MDLERTWSVVKMKATRQRVYERQGREADQECHGARKIFYEHRELRLQHSRGNDEGRFSCGRLLFGRLEGFLDGVGDEFDFGIAQPGMEGKRQAFVGGLVGAGKRWNIVRLA